MENPFEIIVQKLNAIDKRLHSIETKLNTLESSNNLMDTKQVSEYLKLAVPTIYDKVHKREIPHLKTGNKLYFDKNEIDGWLLNGKVLTKDKLNLLADEYLQKNRI